MKKCLYAISPFFLALALRLYPFLMSGMPLSTDAWPLIRNTEILLAYTPVHLGNDEVFDGYNNFWPANTLFGAVFSRVTGLEAIVAMEFGIPLAGALTILIFYALVKKATGSIGLAFIASVILANAFPYSLFTAGVTKETYANPIYMLSILIFLSDGGWGKVLMFIIASIALVLAHHLTTAVTIAILANIALANSIVRARRGLSLHGSSFLLVLILAATAALYFGLFAHKGFKIRLDPSDWLSAASHQTIALALSVYLALRPHVNRHKARAPIAYSMAPSLTLLLVLLCTRRAIVPGAPVLPSHYLIYAAPLIIASPLIISGLKVMRGMGGEYHMAPLFWLAAILGLESYAVFSSQPVGVGLAYRAINFLLPPLATLYAIGLQGLRSAAVAKRQWMKGLMELTVALALLSITTLSLYSMYAAVSMQERYLGYFWLYRLPEFQAGSWLTKGAVGTVACDVKFAYMLRHYFALKVDEFKGLLYLSGKASSKPDILIAYDQMPHKGYVVYGGFSIDLPEGWMEKANSLSLVYTNGIVSAYSGCEA